MLTHLIRMKLAGRLADEAHVGDFFDSMSWVRNLLTCALFLQCTTFFFQPFYGRRFFDSLSFAVVRSRWCDTSDLGLVKLNMADCGAYIASTRKISYV
jgi:hypothetical protein